MTKNMTNNTLRERERERSNLPSDHWKCGSIRLVLMSYNNVYGGRLFWIHNFLYNITTKMTPPAPL